MRPRDVLILCGTVGMALGIGLVLMSSETLAVELPPNQVANGPDAPATAPAEAPEQAPVPVDDGGPIVVAVRDLQPHPDTKGMTSGIVRGDVQIAVSILDKIQSLSVVVEELRNPIAPDGSFRHPWKKLEKVTLGIGTPTFEVRDIPFSEYPYRVSLFSPGLNGGQRTVPIDADHALHEDLLLSLTPGAPFSVLLRDQDQNVFPSIDVAMVPVGDPLGRPVQKGTSDNFGSIVFDSVLAGDYEIRASEHGVPLGENQVITVQPGGRMFGPKVQGQGFAMTIDRGVPLEIEVVCAGYGVPDAKVLLQASDRVKLTQYELPTGFNGRATFQHLPPGLWQIDVVKDDYSRRTAQITLKAGEPPPPLRIDVVRLR